MQRGAPCCTSLPAVQPSSVLEDLFRARMDQDFMPRGRSYAPQKQQPLPQIEHETSLVRDMIKPNVFCRSPTTHSSDWNSSSLLQQL
jgi:hypothetical protein